MNNQGKLTTRLLIAGCFVLPVSAQEEDFRIETQFSYDNIDPDGSSQDVDVFALRGTYFLSPVPTAGVPVGEAAFIHRASYAEVIASQVDAGDDDLDVFAANVGYHVPNTIFFGRVGVIRTDFPGPGDAGDEDTNWNGTFGIVPIPRLFFGTDFSEGGYDPNVTAKYVGELANKHWYAARVNVIDVDGGDTEAGFDFDYYFPAFKLGASYSTLGDSFGGRVEVGLPHGFALQGRVYTADDADGIGLNLTWRDL